MARPLHLHVVEPGLDVTISKSAAVAGTRGVLQKNVHQVVQVPVALRGKRDLVCNVSGVFQRQFANILEAERLLPSADVPDRLVRSDADREALGLFVSQLYDRASEPFVFAHDEQAS